MRPRILTPAERRVLADLVARERLRREREERADARAIAELRKLRPLRQLRESFNRCANLRCRKPIPDGGDPYCERHAIEHGTNAGYRRCRLTGACDECKAAHAKMTRDRQLRAA